MELPLRTGPSLKTYLFLAVPNFSGSTLLHSLLETCPDVVPLTLDSKAVKKIIPGFVEGNVVAPRGYRNLLGPHSIEANMEQVYANPKNYDWKFIRNTWDANWELSNPAAQIRMQKTPSDIFRMKQIEEYFENLKWIISVRNPYNHVESILRKATFQMDPIRQLEQICFHAGRCLEIQMQNAKRFKKNSYVMTYEAFIARPIAHRTELGKFLPGLEKMSFESEIWVKGLKFTKLKDDSSEKLAAMFQKYPEILEPINRYFRPFRKAFKYWGYSFLG